MWARRPAESGARGRTWLFFGHRNQSTNFFYRRELGGETWPRLAEGALVHVGGDARRMAKDVEAALVDIVARYGARPAEEAIAFMTGLERAGRHHQDV